MDDITGAPRTVDLESCTHLAHPSPDQREAHGAALVRADLRRKTGPVIADRQVDTAIGIFNHFNRDDPFLQAGERMLVHIKNQFMHQQSARDGLPEPELISLILKLSVILSGEAL